MTIQNEHKIQNNIYNICKNQIGQEIYHDRCKYYVVYIFQKVYQGPNTEDMGLQL